LFFFFIQFQTFENKNSSKNLYFFLLFFLNKEIAFLSNYFDYFDNTISFINLNNYEIVFLINENKKSNIYSKKIKISENKIINIKTLEMKHLNRMNTKEGKKTY